jgi:hypothetical protein
MAQTAQGMHATAGSGTRAGLDAKKFYNSFRCYLVNIVQSYPN